MLRNENRLQNENMLRDENKYLNAMKINIFQFY